MLDAITRNSSNNLRQTGWCWPWPSSFTNRSVELQQGVITCRIALHRLAADASQTRTRTGSGVAVCIVMSGERRSWWPWCALTLTLRRHCDQGWKKFSLNGSKLGTHARILQSWNVIHQMSLFKPRRKFKRKIFFLEIYRPTFKSGKHTILEDFGLKLLYSREIKIN